MTEKPEKFEMVKEEQKVLAGGLKIAAYRVRDPKTGVFSEPQFHATYENTVLAVMGQQAAILFSRFIATYYNGYTVENDRVKELLEHNSRQLEENRALRKVVKRLSAVVNANHQKHKDNDDLAIYKKGEELFDANTSAIAAAVKVSISDLHKPEKQS